MRGKDLVQKCYSLYMGITPAYAGKRSICTHAYLMRQDHPRLCGEKSFSSSVFKSAPGSPPPMRGKVLHDISCSVVLGITPAYAGKSSEICHVLRREVGSPPPMRGKVVSGNRLRAVNRITPAYAGKSNNTLGIGEEA